MPTITANAGGPKGSVEVGGIQQRPQTQGKAPCWRKSKQEKVDIKIEKMLEAYKVINEIEARRATGEGPAEQRRKLAQKYFPNDEEEDGGAAAYMDSERDALEDIIQNDDSESDGTHQI